MKADPMKADPMKADPMKANPMKAEPMSLVTATRMAERMRHVTGWLLSLAVLTKSDGIGREQIAALAEALADSFSDEVFSLRSVREVASYGDFFPRYASLLDRLTSWDIQTHRAPAIDTERAPVSLLAREYLAAWVRAKREIDVGPTAATRERGFDPWRGAPGRLAALADLAEWLRERSPEAWRFLCGEGDELPRLTWFGRFAPEPPAGAGESG